MKNKLKKTTVGILAAVMVLLIGVTSVFAGVQKRSENFTDTNYNGVCDHHGTCIPGACSGTWDENNFVDTDNNGVCDNYGTHHQGACIGSRDRKDCTDGNHDGVCNYRVAGKEDGQGRGFGRRCHR